MISLKVNNYRETLYNSLKMLNDNGIEIIPRGMKTIELENVLIEVLNPKDKIALVEGRKANIFSTLAETLWVLGGRNDIEFISHYVPKMDDFSDPTKVLYGGYGPRIQNWYGVNQFEEIYRILVSDPNSRRAIISLFDPARDFFSDDFPCSNWLHFTIRNGRLNLKVASRSMDIIWGSTLNFFEWSVVQEIMAKWLNVEIGKLTYFISSLHIYEPFYERMNDILKYPLNIDIINPIEWDLPKDIFYSELKTFFTEEAQIRELKTPNFDNCKSRIIKVSLKLLLSYNYHKNKNYDKVVNVLNEIEDCDLKIMAIDFYKRNINYSNLL